MNEPKALEVYLNDHLAGSVGAVEIAKRCAEDNAGTELGRFLSGFLNDVEEDQRTLEGLLDSVGASRNPFKQAGAWLGEKLSRLKLGTEQKDLSNLLSIEALVMGVQGKISLWGALREIAAHHEGLSSTDFDALLARAEAQQEVLERHRLELARAALGSPVSV